MGEVESLRAKAEELWKIICSEQQEKDGEFKVMQEKLAEKCAAKAAKKGVDMEKFYPGKHPPKMQITSKYDNRKGERSYTDRKDMYEEGMDVVRPKLLEEMWNTKFNAWMDETNRAT